MIPACAVCGETRFELHQHTESKQWLCEKDLATVQRDNVVPLHRIRTGDPADPVESVRTAALLASILAFITRFIVLSSEAQARVIALWIAHTHAIDAAEATLYLAVVSAEKRSGKSRLLELLDKLVARGRHTPNISEAALYRVLETVKPTLLVDEVDALFKAGSERTEALRGILNAGNRRGAVVYRCDGPKSETRSSRFSAPRYWRTSTTALCPTRSATGR